MMPSNSLCALNPFSLEGEMGVAIQSGGRECREVLLGCLRPLLLTTASPQLPHRQGAPEQPWRGVQRAGPSKSGDLAAPVDSLSFLVAGVLLPRRGQKALGEIKLQDSTRVRVLHGISEERSLRCRHEDLSRHYLQFEPFVCTGSGEGWVSETCLKGQAQSGSLLSDLGKVASLGPRRLRTPGLWAGVRMTEMVTGHAHLACSRRPSFALCLLPPSLGPRHQN